MSRAYGDRAPRWRRYLRFWGRNLEADLDDELRFHIEMREQEYRAEGMSISDARAAVMERFGDVARVRESCSEIDHRREKRMHFTESLATVRQDAEYALRQLRRSPSFALAATLTLALGIGANSAIFGLIDSVLLRPLPGIHEPGRLVEMTSFSVSYPAYRDFRDAGKGTVDIAGFRERPMAVRIGGATDVLLGSLATGNYFSTLGAAAGRGRTLSDADDVIGARPVAVISHALWRRHFDERPDVLGETIQLNGVPFTIVGVMGRPFRGTRLVGVPDFWVPMQTWPLIQPSSYEGLGLESRGWSWMSTIGRLAPGATIAQAEAILTASAKRQLEIHPQETRSNTDITVEPAATTALGRGVGGTATLALAMLAGVVSIVLLIACANIANLLLARAAVRRREIGVRLALGASRRRLVRQLVTESMVLATIAGLVGLATAWLVLGVVRTVDIGNMVSFATFNLGISPRIAAFTLGMSMLTGLVFGLIPAFAGSRVDSSAVLKDGSAGAGRRRSRLRDSLLVAQIALSLVLLVGAGLFIRGLQRALTTEIGFNIDGIALAHVDPSLVKYGEVRGRQYYEDAMQRIAALPGVRSVATALEPPLTSGANSETATLEGYVTPDGKQVELDYNIVSREYLRTVEIPLVAGRDFDRTDTRESPRSVIVNEALAARYWPGSMAVGKRIVMSRRDTLTVVGVARNAKYHSLSESPMPHIYTLVDQQRGLWTSPMTLLVRTDGDVDQLLAPIRSALRQSSADVPVVALASFADQFATVLAPQRIAATLLGFFGLLALAVAAVGVSGVVAYALSQRTREIGIRMALGAPSGSVLRMILGENLRRVLIGVVLGLALAAAASQVAVDLLYGVSAIDPVTFLVTPLLLVAVALGAALLPARRATKVDPLIALRSE